MQKSRLEVSRKTRERPGGHWAYTNKFWPRHHRKKLRREQHKITADAVTSFYEDQRLDWEEARILFDDWWWEDFEEEEYDEYYFEIEAEPIYDDWWWGDDEDPLYYELE